MKKIIIIVVAVVVLLGGGVGATLYFTGALSDSPSVASAMPEGEPDVPEEIFYYEVQPEFVVNFQGKGRQKFLMIELSVATNDQMVKTILNERDPELRNELLELLSEQDSEVLKTTEGKRELRTAAKDRIDEIVGRYYEKDKIVDVYFRKMVMQ